MTYEAVGEIPMGTAVERFKEEESHGSVGFAVPPTGQTASYISTGSQRYLASAAARPQM